MLMGFMLIINRQNGHLVSGSLHFLYIQNEVLASFFRNEVKWKIKKKYSKKINVILAIFPENKV